MVFFFRSVFFQVLLNAYFLYRIQKTPEIPSWLKWLLNFIYCIEVLLYFTGLLASERLSVEVFTLIQKISGIWIISHIYLMILVLTFDLINYFHRKRPVFVRMENKSLRRIKFYCFLLMIVFIGFRLYQGYDHFIHPVVKSIPFSFNKPEDDPDARPRARYKLLVVSDLHLGYIIDRKILRKYVDLMNDQHADIVVVNGDLIDFDLRPLVAGRMDEELRRIEAPKGLFFIPGNHEYKFNPEIKLDWIARAGFTILRDSVAVIDHRLSLIGRDDRRNENRLPAMALMNQVDWNLPCIFLVHQPADIKEAHPYRIPLTICGHTHGGQVFPMNLAVHFLYTNGYGMHRKDNQYSYTSSGLGLSGFPLRIASDSELVIFNIEIY